MVPAGPGGVRRDWQARGPLPAPPAGGVGAARQSAAGWGEPGAASPRGAAGAGCCPGRSAGGVAVIGVPLLAVSAARSLSPGHRTEAHTLERL